MTYRLRIWKSDKWNRVDLLSHTLFLIAVIMRFTLKAEEFELARWFFGAALAVYFVRFTQVFYIYKTLGPKIAMIQQMVSAIIDNLTGYLILTIYMTD